MIIPHSDSGDGHELLAGTAPTLMLPLLGTRAVEGVITADVGRRRGEGTFHCTSSRASPHRSVLRAPDLGPPTPMSTAGTSHSSPTHLC